MEKSRRYAPVIIDVRQGRPHVEESEATETIARLDVSLIAASQAEDRESTLVSLQLRL